MGGPTSGNIKASPPAMTDSIGHPDFPIGGVDP
jgi:hypothetical protein